MNQRNWIEFAAGQHDESREIGHHFQKTLIRPTFLLSNRFDRRAIVSSRYIDSFHHDAPHVLGNRVA